MELFDQPQNNQCVTIIVFRAPSRWCGRSRGDRSRVCGRRTRPDGGREKGTSLNSTCLTPKPLAPSVYVHVPEAPSLHERSMSVTSLFRSPNDPVEGWVTHLLVPNS